MSQLEARQAFETLLATLPSDAYTIRADYENSKKLEIRRSYGSPKVVLVWSSNGLDNEFTTRTEYAAKLSQWFPGFSAEPSKPQYSRTFSITASQLNATIANNKTDIAAAIVAIDQSR